MSVIKNVPFCHDIAVINGPGSLPLTSMTAGTTPSGITNYSIKNINLAAGTAQLCGTDTSTPLTTGTPPAVAPVATNTGGSATNSIPIFSQNECVDIRWAPVALSTRTRTSSSKDCSRPSGPRSPAA